MDQQYSIIKHIKGKHLNYDERMFIQIRLADGWSAYHIAKTLGCSQNTVRNEINRGTVTLYNGNVQRYKAETGQQRYIENRQSCKKAFKFLKCKPFIDAVISDIKNCAKIWSVDASRGRILSSNKFQRSETVCTKTLYNYIDMGLLPVKNIDLPVKTRRKPVKKRTPGHSQSFGKSIDERPESCADRNNFGHWEIDTMISIRDGRHEALLTLTERKTDYSIVLKISSKDADSVMKGIERIKAYFGDAFHKVFRSIVSDNGKEFSRLPELESSDPEKSVDIFYAHPYSAYERGINERHNGLVRRFIPKGELFENYSDDDISFIADWMNGLPRRIFEYRTPEELFDEELDNIYRCTRIKN